MQSADPAIRTRACMCACTRTGCATAAPRARWAAHVRGRPCGYVAAPGPGTYTYEQHLPGGYCPTADVHVLRRFW